ncbi:hypothetical protein [Demequina maris]|uniref:hypothetical protein n=1 Tax=Demequina maris TaxID=1638982 RepID=UPI0007862752|nr:hypothetical protein [Demequina maris]
MTTIPEPGSPEDHELTEQVLALLIEARDDPGHPFWKALDLPRNRPAAAALMGMFLAHRPTPPDPMTLDPDVRDIYFEVTAAIARDS